jgi:hypothetical protein
MWVVGSLKTKVGLVAKDGDTREITLAWADGMVGALPVFASKEAADAYANGVCQVMEVRDADGAKA